MTIGTTAKRKRANWFFWWQVDSWELRRQVADYSRLSLTQSARGQSLICMLVTAGLTVVAALLTGHPAMIVDGVVAVILGLCMLGANRWSKIAAMAYWTLEKLVGVIAALFGPTHGFFSLGQVLFWAVFMHFFYMAYRVEQERRRPTLPDVEAVFS